METNTHSKTMVTYPIVSALVKSEQFLGAHRIWRPVNSQQAHFLSEIFESCRDESTKLPEIESLASRSVDEINAFLRQRGFDIQLEPFSPPDFGAASILDLLVKWLQPGRETVVGDDTHPDGFLKWPPAEPHYPAVQLTGGVCYFQSDMHPHPIAAITTKSEDVVYMTMMDDAPDDFDLITVAEELTNTSHTTDMFSGLVFPMVDLDQRVDISWLLEMATIDENGIVNKIAQALQQTTLKMNEEGARARSAVAIQMTRSTYPTQPNMIINRPFLIWFVRQGLSKPLFVGYITQEDWKRPASIM
jgi:Serpin (serine protease inhibitor)